MISEIRPLIPVPKLSDERMLELYKKLMEEKPKPVIPNIQESFYRIDLQKILSSTTSKYRSFLREAEYGDLNTCSHLDIAKNMLRIDQNVRNAAARSEVTLTGNDNDYVVNINQIDARKIVEAMGYKLLTACLMYNLFIPYIKDLAQQDNSEARVALDEMVNIKAEWLEDLILDKNRIRIRAKEKAIIIQQTYGMFDRVNINQFGYPSAFRENGEFLYLHPKEDVSVAVRGGYPDLRLSLSNGPFFSDVWTARPIGIRLARIIY